MEELKQKVYQSASEGKGGLLDTILKNKSHKEIQTALNHKTQSEDGVLTPLLIASKNQQVATVRLLLETYAVFADQTGKVVIEKENYENVTALWITGYTGNTQVATLLLLHGANVNFRTSTLSTPLRPAIFENHTEMIQLLVKERADANATNVLGHSLLANIDSNKETAADILRILLQAGANPNYIKPQTGESILHLYAGRGDNAEFIEELLMWEAFPQIQDNDNITPIEIACDKKNHSVVKSLLTHKSFSGQQKINYCELLAAEYVYSDTNKCFEMLSKLMKQRENNNLPKKINQPQQIYENRTETNSSEELNKLKGDQHLLSLECLMIRERVYGRSHCYLPFDIRYKGAHLCDEGQYEKGLVFVLRSLDLQQQIKSDASGTLDLATQIMACLINSGKPPMAQTIVETFRKCINEYHRCLSKWKTTLQKQLTCNAIQLTGIITKVKYTPAERNIFINLLASFKNIHEKSGSLMTPLHYACMEETYNIHENVAEACAFPNLELLKLLLDGGCGPNVQDNDGNTPLHILVQYASVTSEVATLKGAVAIFVDAEANMEIKNKAGENALQVM